MTSLFGYIRPVKAELKVKEYETYRAIYCGLCKQLGQEYGLSSRFTLSYDYTFLSLLALGLDKKDACFQRERCMVHPFAKRACLAVRDDLSLTAAAAILMIYYKIKDNFQDGTFKDKLKILVMLPFFVGKKKKAERKFPALGQAMRHYIAAQNTVEQADLTSIDAAAEPTAQVLSAICAMLVPEDQDRRVLTRVGYLVGRYVYLIDALDDLDQDIADGNYNVFAKKVTPDNNTEQVRWYGREVLNLTVGQIAESYELLTLERYKSILDNIIYLGLHDSLNRVIERKPIEKARA